MLTPTERFVLEYFKADLHGAVMYWAHGEGCSQVYRIDVTQTCSCGVDKTSEALKLLQEEVTEKFTPLTGSFESIEEAVEYLDYFLDSSQAS